jgi:hypothetical protein
MLYSGNGRTNGPKNQVPKERLYAFLDEAKEDEVEAVKSLRAWWLQLEEKG